MTKTTGNIQTKGGLGLTANRTQNPVGMKGGPPRGYKVKSPVGVKSNIGLKQGPGAPGMCAYHAELPAAFICNRCGKSICSTCAVRYGQVVFCPQCSPVSQSQQPQGYGQYPYSYPYYPYYYPYYRQPTNVASTGGILTIFAGILGFIYIATMIMLPSQEGIFNPFLFGTAEAIFCLSFPLISSTIAVVGGIYAYHKTNFSIAIVGGIFSLFVVGFFIGSILGFVGLILIGTGRFEFEDVKSQLPQQPGQGPGMGPGQQGY
jgi:hypothetical protein